MTVTTLPRAKTFHDDVAALVQRTPDKGDLPEQIAELHEACTRPLHAKLRDLERENSQMGMDLRRKHAVLGQVENLVVHNIQTTASQHATLAAQSHMLRQVRKLAQGAFDGKVPADDLLSILVSETKPPEIYGVTLAFIPSEQYRAGTFVSDTRDVAVTYTFVGWTTVSRHIGGGIVVEPTFLVGDRGALPVSQIEAENHLRLEYPMLPHLRAI